MGLDRGAVRPHLSPARRPGAFAEYEGVTIAPRAMVHGAVPVIRASSRRGLRGRCNALTFPVGDVPAAADAVERLHRDLHSSATLRRRAPIAERHPLRTGSDRRLGRRVPRSGGATCPDRTHAPRRSTRSRLSIPSARPRFDRRARATRAPARARRSRERVAALERDGVTRSM